MAAKEKEYTGADIQVLTDREHVRLRTNVYLGNMNKVAYPYPKISPGKFSIENYEFVPSVFKAVGEIYDNSIDEFTKNRGTNKTLTLIADPEKGEHTIADNGRGIPIDMHATGKYTPEVALGSLRSGRNFSDEKEAGVIGANGVGSACTNYCSVKFEVVIHRDNKKYVQTFTDGAATVSEPKITRKAGETGTSVSFKLDPAVFKDVSLPYEMVRSRAQGIAFNNPDITVDFNGEEFRYKKGFEELLKTVSDSYFKIPGELGDFYVCFDKYQGLDEQMFTWVNSSLLLDGGICNTQFMNAFSAKVCEHLASAAKKQKCEVTKNDVKKDLLVFGILKVSNPEYDAQSKTRLTGPNMRKPIEQMIDAAWAAFARKHKVWLELVLASAAKRHHGSKDKDAADAHMKSLKKKVPGLMDATGKNRLRCQLLICEGLSAAAQICEVRNPETTGSFPLTGKINNVYGSTIAQLLSMGKVTDLLAAIGLVPGKRASRVALNFARVVISTDADVDGGNIFTQLINIFYQFWPEMFDPENEAIVYRLQAPNVVASKGNKRIHYVNREEYEKKKDTLKGYTIEYMKGLGSMSKEDWVMILDNPEKYQTPILDDGRMKETLKLLFSPDSDARKEWLKAEND
jgi:DNA gyrase/topoisomerase IV subunit B